ncbi:MAG: transglutaminase-like domain-containing protein [Rickettsiales bacterium]|nr:transglutaminase-like domain-containing protein [Rickettsiales bacterium]
MDKLSYLLLTNSNKNSISGRNIGLFNALLIIIYISANNVLADLLIQTWNQKNIFNDAGQDIEVTVKLKALLDKPNYYYEGWSISFDEKSRVNLIESRVLSDDDFSSSFGGNKLEFKFGKIFNSQEVEIKFRYQLDNDDIQKTPYLRQELVAIPAFARGAEATLEVRPLTNMTLYSLNYLFSRDDEIFTWSGIVGDDGFRDIFAMTREKGKWKVSTSVALEDSDGIGNLTVKLPLNYVGGNNEILEYRAYSGQSNYIDDEFIKKSDEGIEFKFRNFNSENSFVRLEAIIFNSYDNFNWENNFSFNATTKLGKDDSSYFSGLVNEIASSSDAIDLPAYVKIAKWVYNNITYDDELTGVEMTSREILKTKKGVCEHYAILYQDLLRAINIPSKTVSGLSYNFDKQHFENHAWVVIYHNSTWIPIDPTWGIYSGKLPISHIFIYNDTRNIVRYSRNGPLDNLKTTIKYDAEFLQDDF